MRPHCSTTKYQILSNGMEHQENRCSSGVRLIFWILLCFSLFGIFFTNVFQVQYYQTVQTARFLSDNEADVLINKQQLEGFLIKTPGCRIPEMDPFDKKIRKFIEAPHRPICYKGIPPLVDSNSTSIFIVASSLEFYKNYTKLKCCYTPFKRRSPNSEDDDFVFKYAKKCIAFKNHTEIQEEFIKVTCKSSKHVIYTDFFSFVPLKKPKTSCNSSKLNPSVLILGIDALSRLNFVRQMPKTVDYLLNNLSAIEMLGFNKVGDNTFPNLIPFLTGLNETELEKVCWKTNLEKRFDECPFIWDEFANRGYLTAFGEDASWMGIFNYQRRGFKKQPTDYMWGPFNRLSEHEIGNSHNLNVEECVGSREVYKVFLDYIRNFVTKMQTIPRKPYFGFFWAASLTHDDLNKPKLGDLDYLHLFEFLRNYLNDTVVIVMSDHGIRWGGIRQTYQGRMEERLPFVYFLLPHWYKQQNKQSYVNMLRNTRRLTTPFDLHETLLDLVSETREHLDYKRGQSLFKEIATNRTCETAEISSHFCTCQQSNEIDTEDFSVLESAQFALDFINNKLLSGYADCAVLHLANVTTARIMKHDENVFTNNDFVQDYTINMQTYPGDGIFEVTVRRRLNPDDKTYQNEIMGTISRLNLYGRQSACITDFHLKLYCYCK